ncbi:MAG TPA: 5-bromo-4-chloroindolyl phosphate hydrolysis family protein, partial [Ktedonobacteraceae bacterium]|nr:5-bromo-4-chloroindolyl phosphate hydrolysis family protein [Ktedonobacteraceae bacterium]
MKIARYATWIALGIGAATFLAAYYLLAAVGWTTLVAVGVAAVLCLCAAFASWLLLDRRSTQEIRSDEYILEAEQKVQQLQQKLRQLNAFAARIRQRETAALLIQLCNDVDQLILRIRAKNKAELLSSAETVSNYINQVVSVAEQYIDIEAYPRYYKEPERKLAQIQQSLRSFDEYLV